MLGIIIILFGLFTLKVKTRKIVWKVIRFPFWLLFIYPIKLWYKKKQLIKKVNLKAALIEKKKLEKEKLKKEKIQQKIDEIKNKIENNS